MGDDWWRESCDYVQCQQSGYSSLVNVAADNGNTPLHAAVNRRDVAVVRELLNSPDINVDVVNHECDDVTPLLLAAMHGLFVACAHEYIVRLNAFAKGNNRQEYYNVIIFKYFCVVSIGIVCVVSISFVVEGVMPRGRPKRTWKEVVEGDMKSLKLRKEDALVYGKWRRLIRDTVKDSDDSGG